ncbi:hypothetical protein HKD37_12G033755 [Glycine soja]
MMSSMLEMERECHNGLGGLMRMAGLKGLFLGYNVGNGSLKVSLLQFADDPLFLGEPAMRDVFFHKIHIAGIGVSEGVIQRSAMLVTIFTIIEKIISGETTHEESIGASREWFWSRVKREHRSGERIMFWEHLWVGKELLSMGYWFDGGWEWSLRWRRSFFEWEEELVIVLMRELSGSMPKREIESGFLGLGRGQFKSFVREACLCVQPLCDQYVPSSFYRQIWKLPIPSKLSLLEEGQQLCCFYYQVVETTTHLFFSYHFALLVWRSCYSWFGVSLALPDMLEMLFLQHSGLLKGNKGKNNIIFNNVQTNLGIVIEMVVVRLWMWLKVNAKRIFCFIT